ncbi:MAG TPA: hypothetical protein VHT31_04660 [Candidatus Acidoferrum sp.]|jgi:hypothetical protein|nr:hypothetical protein [Candidatus Acidoferrum sp.]
MPATILGRIGIVVQANHIFPTTFFPFAFAAHQAERVIDDARSNIQDLPMSQVTSSSQRRSSRMFHKMRMQAQGRAHNGKKFRETCETLVVNGHGGLLILKHEIDDGAMLVLTHPETLEEQECRVVFVGETNDRGQRVGVEFLTPAPRFWGLEFDEPSSGGSAV